MNHEFADVLAVQLSGLVLLGLSFPSRVNLYALPDLSNRLPPA